MRNNYGWVWFAVAVLALLSRAAAAEAPSRTVDEIAIVVDQDAMTKGEMEESISDLFLAQGLKAPAPGSPDYEQAKKDVVESFIREVLLAEEADREKVEISDGEVDHQVDGELENMKKRFSSDAEFQDGLKKEGLSEDDLRAYIHDQLLRRLKANRVLQMKQHDLPGSVFVGDDEVKKYFDQHPKDYEQVKFSIILFRIPPKSKPAYVAEVEKQAKDVLANLKGGADFAATARKYSEDSSSAQNGGDVGTHYRVDLDPQLAAGVFAIPNKGLGLVKTADGIYVVKIDHKGTADYDAVAPDIKAHLMKQKQDSSLSQFIDELKKNAYIVEDGKVVAFQPTAPEETASTGGTTPSAPATQGAGAPSASGTPAGTGPTASNAMAPVSATPSETVTKGIYPTLPPGGGFTLELEGQGLSYGTQDLSNYYGPGVNTNQGFPYGFGFHAGLEFAVDPTIQFGIKAEVLRKFTETVNFSPENLPSYSDQWSAGTGGGALEAKLLIPLDESTNFILHGAGGYYFLFGASVTVSGAAVTEDANFDGSNFGGDAGGAIEFFLDDSKTSSFNLDVDYRFLKFQPVTSNVTVNNAGPLAITSPLLNNDGSQAVLDFSGLEIGLGLRFYLDKEGS